MNLPEPKKATYTLKEIAVMWECSISDLLCYAEEKILKICKQQNKPIYNLFGSDEEKEAALKFSKDLIPIDHQEARQLEKEYRSYPDHAEPISLVITYQEKERFKKEECNSLKLRDQEEYPGEPGEMTLVGWRAICKPFNLKVGKAGKKPKSMNKHTEKKNFPLMRMPGIKRRPYTYLSQIKIYLAAFQKK